MASVLVAYGSGEGQTATVARFIESILEDRGHECTLYDVSTDETFDVGRFDATLVGSPVNNRRHHPDVVEFVTANADALTARPSGFFQLSLASLLPSRLAKEVEREFVDDLVDQTGWRPDEIGRFAGAVKYTQYGAVQRYLFRLVSAVLTGDTDTSRDYEYTDWDEVRSFAHEFATFVDERVAPTEPEKTGLRRVMPSSRGRVALGVGIAAAFAGVVYWLRGRESTSGRDEQPEHEDATVGGSRRDTPKSP